MGVSEEKQVPAEAGGSEVADEPEQPSRRNAMLGAAGGAFGVVVSRTLPPGVRDGLVIGGFVGALLGLLPFAVARSRGLPDEGTRALGFCAMWGVFGGVILALPACLYLTYRVATAEVEP